MKGIFNGYSFEDEVAEKIRWIGNGVLLKNVFLYSYNLRKYTEIDMIYVTPYKLYCIECKSFRTKLVGNMGDAMWTGKSGRYFTKIYNPYFQNTEHIRCIKRRLRELNCYTNAIENVIVTRDSCIVESDYKNILPLKRLVSKIRRESIQHNETILDVNKVKMSLLKIDE